MEMHHFGLDEQLRILKDFCSNMCMTVNIDKTKIMIIKSKKETYVNFLYDNKKLEEVTSYKYLGIDIHITSSIGTIALRKGLMEV